MNEGRRIASYSLSPEAEGKAEYVSTSIASYLKYSCAYCMEKFYLVDPYTKRSGGCAQRLILRNKNTNERIPTNEVHAMCNSCFHDIMQDKHTKEVKSILLGITNIPPEMGERSNITYLIITTIALLTITSFSETTKKKRSW